MGEGPGGVIEYAQLLPRGRGLQRRSVPVGILAAVAGAAAFGVARLSMHNPFAGVVDFGDLAIPLYGVGMLGFLAAPVFGLWAVAYAVCGIILDGRVGKAGIATLLLVGLAGAGWCGAILVIRGG